MNISELIKKLYDTKSSFSITSVHRGGREITVELALPERTITIEVSTNGAHPFTYTCDFDHVTDAQVWVDTWTV